MLSEKDYNDIYSSGYEDGKKEQQQEIDRLNNIIDDLREYMLDIDYKMGWQYAEYLDELLGIKSNYKKYGIAIDLKKEGKNNAKNEEK